MIGTAVEAPGEAPSRPAIEPSCCRRPPRCRTGSRRPCPCRHLMTCTRWPAADAVPVLLLALGRRTPAAPRTWSPCGAQHLADEVPAPGRGCVSAGPDHRAEVVQPDRREQVQLRAGLEELGREPGVRAEQQARLAVDDAGVEVRHRHRRGARRPPCRTPSPCAGPPPSGLSVRRNSPLIGNPPYPRISLMPGRLQQVEGAAAGADEHEPRVNARAASRRRRAAPGCSPDAVLAALEAGDPALDVQSGAARRRGRRRGGR